MDMKHKGFTLIEVLIVIAVIAVLASIAIVSYRSVRENGLDAKIRSAVKTAGDAAALAEARGKRITGFGPFTAPDGVQTLVPDYLKADYRQGVSSKKAANEEAIFRIYECHDGGKGFVIYAALNNPSTEDVATFNRIRSSCHHNSTQAPDSGSTIYSYAQLF